ncbi:MAG: ABC transporter substrate-binding protein [Opitutales bacterium]
MNPDVKICVLFWVIITQLLACSLFADFARIERSSDEIVLVDSMGNSLSFDTSPRRIVSLDSGIVEIFFELDAEGYLVGRTRFADYPAGTAGIEDIGGLIDPNFEKLAVIDPDLILMGRMSANAELLARFSQLGFKVAVLDMDTIEELLVHTELIGSLLGESESARSVLANWDKTLTDLDRQAAKIVASLDGPPTVLLLYGLDGFYSAGSGTWPDAILNRAGVVNLAASAVSPWPMLSAEGIVSGDPDCILVASSTQRSFETNTARHASIVRKPSSVWKALSLDLEEHIQLAPAGLFVVNGPRIIDSYRALVDLLNALPVN